MNVVVVAAHADDEVLGCGGVMARHAAQGDAVHVLIVTRGIPEIFPPDHVDLIFRELRAAHALLGGAGIHFLDFPSPRLDTVAGYLLADAIKRVVQELRPEVVYAPYQGDLHGDHQAVYQATLVAARPIDDCSVRRLLCYETLSETDWASPFGNNTFTPTVFVEITDFLELKLKAMECYRTQTKAAPHSRSLPSIEALARLRGGTVSVSAAEAFMLVREVVR
ncbi:PIG-L family deacetylase [Oscillochloris sp. ZM17-4]|uniref:PIG-L deacetylase family protein n=1 Tax=Oscillochloris sp. ZM17-4 TaxID=2866714 RepID=UPI001C72C240|nr:PIG-L deacetylase family protein [Oscillochloris sp. ZM17-4]MBX0331337.1 PIG-L family deacetylase [Oscillochloris sp. ZM17-4]